MEMAVVLINARLIALCVEVVQLGGIVRPHSRLRRLAQRTGRRLRPYATLRWHTVNLDGCGWGIYIYTYMQRDETNCMGMHCRHVLDRSPLPQLHRS